MRRESVGAACSLCARIELRTPRWCGNLRGGGGAPAPPPPHARALVAPSRRLFPHAAHTDREKRQRHLLSPTPACSSAAIKEHLSHLRADHTQVTETDPSSHPPGAAERPVGLVRSARAPSLPWRRKPSSLGATKAAGMRRRLERRKTVTTSPSTRPCKRCSVLPHARKSCGGKKRKTIWGSACQKAWTRLP